MRMNLRSYLLSMATLAMGSAFSFAHEPHYLCQKIYHHWCGVPGQSVVAHGAQVYYPSGIAPHGAQITSSSNVILHGAVQTPVNPVFLQGAQLQVNPITLHGAYLNPGFSGIQAQGATLGQQPIELQGAALLTALAGIKGVCSLVNSNTGGNGNGGLMDPMASELLKRLLPNIQPNIVPGPNPGVMDPTIKAKFDSYDKQFAEINASLKRLGVAPVTPNASASPSGFLIPGFAPHGAEQPLSATPLAPVASAPSFVSLASMFEIQAAMLSAQQAEQATARAAFKASLERYGKEIESQQKNEADRIGKILNTIK